MKRKKSSAHRDHELQSDDEEFEVAAGIKDDDDTVSPNNHDNVKDLLFYCIIKYIISDISSCVINRSRPSYLPPHFKSMNYLKYFNFNPVTMSSDSKLKKFFFYIFAEIFLVVSRAV